MDLLQYGRKESLFSDHRPVHALFSIKVCKIYPKKRDEIEKKLIDQLFNSSKSNITGESDSINL